MFLRGHKGKEILSVCNGLKCNFRELRDSLKEAYTAYTNEYKEIR